MASWSEFKKRFGTAASRDPAVTIGGMFGTEGARKKQKERLSSRAKIDAELARNKRDRESLARSEKIDAELARNKRDRDALKTSAPAPKQEVVMGTASVPTAAKPTPARPVPQATRTVSTPAPAPRATRKAAFRPESIEDFMAGIGEDNAVTKLLRENAAKRKEMKESTDKGAYAKGGKINGCAVKGKTKGRYI